MPELVNYTPFPNFRYYSNDAENREFGIIIVKATYELAPSGRLLVAEEQAPMVFTDLCHGEVNVTSLWHPSDMVPHKPNTDIIVNAVARAPGGKRLASWVCGVKIEDGSGIQLEKLLRVTGPRQWEPVWRAALNDEQKRDWKRHRNAFAEWRLSEPQPITELPLHYEFAYGGEVRQGEDEDGNPRFDTDHRNPLGRGKIDREWTDHTRPVAAPQIEAVGDPVTGPYRQMTPQSLGPIPPAWLPRRPLGGTYDQNWQEKVWPAWPEDYDFAYHNSAHPDLIIKGHLKGGERVTLTGLSAHSSMVAFELPDDAPIVDFETPDGGTERTGMKLDTVFLDIAAEDPRDWRIYLAWRVNFEPDRFEQAKIFLAPRAAENAAVNDRSAA